MTTNDIVSITLEDFLHLKRWQQDFVFYSLGYRVIKSDGWHSIYSSYGTCRKWGPHSNLEYTKLYTVAESFCGSVYDYESIVKIYRATCRNDVIRAIKLNSRYKKETWVSFPVPDVDFSTFMV